MALTSGSSKVILTVVVVAAALFGRAADAPEQWYQAEQRMGVPSRVRIFASVVVFALRMAALVWWPDLWVFAVLFVVENMFSRAPSLLFAIGSTVVRQDLLGRILTRRKSCCVILFPCFSRELRIKSTSVQMS